MPVPRRRRRRLGVLPAATAAAAAGAARVEILEPRTLFAGVELLKDINPQTSFTTTPKGLTDVNGTLYFTAQSKLWKSDGTETGTVKITDSYDGIDNLTNFNGTLFFSSHGQLFKVDPTAIYGMSR